MSNALACKHRNTAEFAPGQNECHDCGEIVSPADRADVFLTSIASEPRGPRPSVQPLPTTDDWTWSDEGLITF